MTREDMLHAQALELAETIVDQLERLEDGKEVLADAGRLVQLLIALGRMPKAS